MAKTKTIYGILVHGKIMYVGQTADLEKRRIMHRNRASCVGPTGNQDYFYSQLRDAGEWKMIVLEVCSYPAAQEKEALWIKKFQTDELGWNVQPSGGAGRQRGCNNPSGPNHYMFGKKMPAHIVEAAAAANRGKVHSPETRLKMSIGQARRKLRGGPVGGLPKRAVIRSDGVEFDSISEAARAMDIAPTGIQTAIKRGRPSRGFLWRYSENKEV